MTADPPGPADADAPLDVSGPPRLEDYPLALSGRAGHIVNALAPHTEADPAALLVTLLTWFGAAVGPGPHMLLSDTEHPAKLWPLIIGNTSGGAKGTSLAVIQALMRIAVPSFSTNIANGLTSGEGLIERVRDARPADTPDEASLDEGVTDKRLLVPESEFATVLARGRREHSTLLPVLRDAWDGKALQTLSRQRNALCATGHHIALLGHISPAELRSIVRATDLSSGTLNRFLFIYSRRRRLLPDGGNIPAALLHELGNELSETYLALSELRPRQYVWAPGVRDYWGPLYCRLRAERPESQFAQATARAHVQVPRLALAFALVDGAEQEIGIEHLEAATDLWYYAEESARWLFTAPDNDARQREVHRLLDYIAAAGQDGVTRTDISNGFYQHNKSAAAIDALLAPLIREGVIAQHTEHTRGRPRARYAVNRAQGADAHRKE